MKLIFGLLVLIPLAACIWPGGRNVTSKTFRGFTISYDKVENANVVGYSIKYKLANRPSYFYSQTVSVHNSFGNGNPTFVIDDMLINEVLSVQVAANVNNVTKDSDYSQFVDVAVRRSEEAGEVPVLPGKPLYIELTKNPGQTRSVIVEWEDPKNIQNADDVSKDIQYTLETCSYNMFDESKTDCKVFAKFLRNKAQNKQSTNETGQLYGFNFHPEQGNELAYVITPVALNGTKGESNEVIKRLDETKTPKKPSNVSSSDVYADQLTLTWIQEDSKAKAYLKISKDKSQANDEVVTATSPYLLTGLKNGTEYEIRVGLYDAKYGGSGWTSKHKVTTTNELAPTKPPTTTRGNSGKMLTSSFAMLFAAVLVVMKMW